MGLGSSILAITVIESIPHSCEFQVIMSSVVQCSTVLCSAVLCCATLSLTQVHGCPVLLGLRELAGHQASCDFRR